MLSDNYRLCLVLAGSCTTQRLLDQLNAQAVDCCSMIRFLKTLFGYSAEPPRADRSVQRAIPNGVPLTRFLFSDKLFARTTGRIKRQAFVPPANARLSVFQIVDLADGEIWRIGNDVVGRTRGEPPRGRADVNIDKVREQSLDVLPDISTHERHANIVGWPAERERVLAISLELADKAKLELPAEPRSS